jgi:HTH-type transcriptional regulator / antitoxin HigA
MEIKPLRNRRDYEDALREIERLWGAREKTPDGDRLDVLTTLVESYEEEHFPIDLPDPIDAIKFRLDQMGLDEKTLVGILGGRSRVHEVMHRKRPLSLEMIRRLHEKFAIPADVLIRRSDARRAA